MATGAWDWLMLCGAMIRAESGSWGTYCSSSMNRVGRTFRARPRLHRPQRSDRQGRWPNLLRIGVQGRPRPDLAGFVGRRLRRRDVFGFGVAEAPELIALDAGRLDTPHMLRAPRRRPPPTQRRQPRKAERRRCVRPSRLDDGPASLAEATRLRGVGTGAGQLGRAPVYRPPLHSSIWPVMKSLSGAHIR